MPVRGKVSRSLEVRSVLVSATIVDAARDFESFIAVTAFVATVAREGSLGDARVIFRIDAKLDTKTTYRVTISGLKKPIDYEVRFF